MTYTWTLLRAGAFRLDGGSMFGVVPKALWSKASPADEHNRIGLQTNCLLLEGGGRRVLIETGFGSKWEAKDRGIFGMEQRSVLDALAERGMGPQDIDTAIVSHLHFDHAGGLTHLDEQGQAMSSFARAEIIVQRQEWEDALANRSTMSRTYLRSHLDPVAGQVRLVEGEAEVLPGIIAWPMVGHTWGQQAIRFQDGAGVVCFPGDVLPTAAHLGSAYNMAYDMLPYSNMQSKAKLLDRAAAEDWRLVLDHEPGWPILRVEADEAKRFRLIPGEGPEGGPPSSIVPPAP